MKQNSQFRKHTIPSVMKTLELVRLLADENGGMTSKGLTYDLGVPRTTCYRILQSLLAMDWVRSTAGGRFVLSLGLIPVLRSLRPAQQIANAAQPTLDNVVKSTQLTAKLIVREGDYAVTVARCESPCATSVTVRLGAAFHLAYGATGAALLSGLSEDEIEQVLERAPEECWHYQKPRAVLKRIGEVRKQGWCAELRKFAPSYHSIAAPLRDADAKVVAGLTIVGFPHELAPERIAAQAKRLIQAVREVEKCL